MTGWKTLNAAEGSILSAWQAPLEGSKLQHALTASPACCGRQAAPGLELCAQPGGFTAVMCQQRRKCASAALLACLICGSVANCRGRARRLLARLC
jgi:hypothetical protein